MCHFGLYLYSILTFQFNILTALKRQMKKISNCLGNVQMMVQSYCYTLSCIIDLQQAKAMGFFNGGFSAVYGTAAQAGGVNTYGGAQAMVDVAEAARKTLDKLRADLGSVQNQLVATINNITVTQVNVKSAESQIRDVDFASESANFSKFNILAQSGSYAMSQANAVQQNILRLLQ